MYLHVYFPSKNLFLDFSFIFLFPYLNVIKLMFSLFPFVLFTVPLYYVYVCIFIDCNGITK